MFFHLIYCRVIHTLQKGFKYFMKYSLTYLAAAQDG